MSNHMIDIGGVFERSFDLMVWMKRERKGEDKDRIRIEPSTILKRRHKLRARNS